MSTKRSCPICRSDATEDLEGAGMHCIHFVDCRACGTYAATAAAEKILWDLPPASPSWLNVFAYTRTNTPDFRETRVLWKVRREVVEAGRTPAIFIADVEDYLERPIRHAEKPNALLKLLCEKLAGQKPLAKMAVSLKDLWLIKIADWDEAREWFLLLESDGLISSNEFDRWCAGGNREDEVPPPPVGVKPAGWLKAEQLFGGVGSRRCFIAMSFKLPNRAEVQKSIADACRETGWSASTVDETQFTGPVMDRILAGINQARFVVADFSENKAGVYYEAGYAEGRQIPVIYTVNEASLDSLHFDTRNLNHIVWKTPSELHDRLVDRIGAVINK